MEKGRPKKLGRGIAVMPFGGPRKHRNQGEWAGSWERFVVSDVVPWADAHLSTVAAASARALAGLSAGGFGALDIGLRNPGIFGTLEAWNGYFTPFRDGPFAHATRAELRANTPTLLVRSRPAIRFFLSTGEAHGDIDPGWTISFARELAALRLPYRLWVLPAHRGHFYRSQLPDALRFALGDRPPAHAQR